MTSVRCGAIALGIFALAGAAQAADLARQMPYPTKAPVYAPIYNWTGLYLGLTAGYGWGRSEWTRAAGTTGEFDLNGGVIGGTFGYNWQMGSFVYGFESDLSWTNIKGDATAAAFPTVVETRNTWLGTVRGRLGYAVDRVMPYITGGLAVGDIDATTPGLAGDHATKAGWTIGGGVEAAIAGTWTAKVEYLYVDLGKFSCPSGACAAAAPVDVDYTASILRAGLNYRF